MACVYRLWCLETGHYYLGATNDVKRREKNWRAIIKRGGETKRWKSLLSDENLRCRESWKIDVVKEFESLEEAVKAETSLLQIHVGLHLCLNSRRTPVNHGSQTNQAREKIRDSRVGKALSDDAKKKLSEANRGESHPMWGKTHSDEAKKKMRQAALGRTSPRKGVTLSEETKQKIRDTKARKRITSRG